MARVFVEECLEKVPNRFELVLLAGHRARQMSRHGAAPALDDDSRPTVVALREIAAEAVAAEDVRQELIESMQRRVEVDEPEAAPRKDERAEGPGACASPAEEGAETFGGMSEEDLLAAIEGLEPPPERREEAEA